MLLYRPLGLTELKLIAHAGWRRWPPRLPDQPIFYPVLTFGYARKIARDWNAKDEFSGFVGFVSRFQLASTFSARYPVQRAGGGSHEELWVPAEDVPDLNANIRGFIEIVEAFAGAPFEGQINPLSHLPIDMSPPETTEELKFACPCCRTRTLRTRSGFEICPVCFWEDDGQDDPDADDVRGGPNGSLSLSDARTNFATFGAWDKASIGSVRSPLPHEV
jgi:Cysteine-rich CPCC